MSTTRTKGGRVKNSRGKRSQGIKEEGGKTGAREGETGCVGRGKQGGWGGRKGVEEGRTAQGFTWANTERKETKRSLELWSRKADRSTACGLKKRGGEEDEENAVGTKEGDEL